MRLVAATYLTVAIELTVCSASAEQHARRVTVILDFDGPHSKVSLAAMQAEAQKLLAKADIRMDVQLSDEVSPSDVFDNVLQVHMRGRCAMDSYPVLFDERGPLGMTYTTDGEILPFGEIRCDQIKNSLKRTMAGDEYQRGDAVLGKALGRVLAHEMYHMLAGVSSHTAEGVTRKGLTSDELRAPALVIGEEALDQVRSTLWR